MYVRIGILNNRRLGKQPDGPLRGVLPTIRYLQKLGLDHFDLVLQYSRWVLEKDPKHGMDVSWSVFQRLYSVLTPRLDFYR